MYPHASGKPIHSDFYFQQKVVKVIASKWPGNAIAGCVRHLQMDDYGADRVEVYDHTNGKLYCVLRTRLNGTAKRKLEVIYERDGTTALNRERDQRRADKAAGAAATKAAKG